MEQFGKSLSISYADFLGYDQALYDSWNEELLSLAPFVWRNSFYVMTYHFTIYRLAGKGELAEKMSYL